MAAWGRICARLASSWRSLRPWVPSSFWAAALVQTVFLVAFAASDAYDVARSGEGSRVVLTYATVLALFGLVHVAVPSRPWTTGVGALVLLLFVGVNFARFETAGAFDYGFAHENFRELTTPLGRQIAVANVRPWEVGALLVLPLAAGAAVLLRPVRPWAVSGWARAASALGCLAFLVGLPMARVSTHESLTGFVVSALRFHAESRAAQAIIQGAPFPFVAESTPTPAGRVIAGDAAPRPHVILLFLESWSARYSDTTRPDGRPVTPVFDRQRRLALTYDHFYGNSVQSSRGHFATLCSLVPMFRGKEFVDLPATHLHCLPRQLQEVGYQTMFYSATDEPDFDGAELWFARNGFADVRFARSRNASSDPAIWGVGVQDDVFYRRFFAALDDKLLREPGRPQLAVLANASHHYPFDQSPTHVPAAGYATKSRRNYVGSLAAADAWLAAFFEELDRRPALRDALVVLVGDHSFPADEHGVHFNGLGAYEEAFHTGFMLRWSGHVAPQVVSDQAASQIDIAPTILDLLQVRARTHFVGTSLLAVGERPPVPLVQPYDGVRLAALKWPLKLVRHESAEQEQLYDLGADPDEADDRLSDPRLRSPLAALRGTLSRIRVSEAVLRADRVWPAP